MNYKHVAIGLLALGLCAPATRRCIAEPPAHRLTFACAEENDLYRALAKGGQAPARFATPAEAIDAAAPDTAVLILADQYPKARTAVDAAMLETAAAKELHLFVEYPALVPGVDLGEPRGVRWERGVVASRSIDLGLPEMHLLALHDCQFLPAKASDPLLVLARVAGFDTAVYGLPAERFPILFRTDDGALIATTKLSGLPPARPSHGIPMKLVS